MSYFKINGIDFSNCVNSLVVNKTHNYSAQTNAAGNTVVDYINSKRTVDVGFIYLTGEQMLALQTAIASFSVSISFYNPDRNSIEENIACIVPDNAVDYYTIQVDKTLTKPFSLRFIEL